MTELPVIQLKRKDMQTDQEVRWCPGCGDYAILKSVQAAMAKLGKPRHEMLVVSGIGCAARFPYYMNCYGFHTIHGRSPAFATAAKMANPGLSVFVIGGDGDMLSIGGNHLIHAIRRNVDINILIINNEIYGLTKGQFSPTSGRGLKTKSSPMGSIDRAFDPIELALGAGATFVARSVDLWGKHLEPIIDAAHAHKGTSVVEILQNCIIYNDGVFDADVAKKVKDDRTIDLVHGEPLVFGKQRDRGIRIADYLPEIIRFEDGFTEADCLVYDAKRENRGLASLLATMKSPEFPVPMGIFRQVEEPSYEELMNAQIEAARIPTGGKKPSLNSLFREGDVWTA
jgi:2-oxoglutarate ferredoxin oxidoreductase subunit beta